MTKKLPQLEEKFFTCHVDHESRLLRGCLGVMLNGLVLLLMGNLPPILFWSLILTSYGLLLEGFFGCSMLHWVQYRRKK